MMSEIGHGDYTEKKNAREISLKDLFRVIKKRIWIVAVIVTLTTLAGYYYSNVNNVLLYQSSTRIIIGSDSGYMKTLMVMIKDPIIMEKVRENLGLRRSSEAIANQVEVSQIDDSQIIKITITDKDSKLAVAIANATAQTYKNEVGNILDFDDVQLLSAAKENPYPINGNQNRFIVMAFVLGIAIGIGLIFMLDALDETVDKEHELEEILGVPVLGVISNMKVRKLSVKQRKGQKVELRGDMIGMEK